MTRIGESIRLRGVAGLAAAVGAGFALGRGGAGGMVAAAALAVLAGALLWRTADREWRRARRRSELREAPSPARQGEAFAGATRLLDSSPRAILLVDREGSVPFSNFAARALLEREPSGRALLASLRDPRLTDALAAPVAPSAEIEIVLHGPGAPRTLKVWIRPISAEAPVPPPREAGAAAVPLKAFLAIEDVTAARREAEIRTEFVANVSHELKTPIAAIQGLAETLQGSAREDPAAQERFLKLIAAQTGRMTRLVEDLLSLRRIETDEHVPPKTVEDLSAILDEALSVVRPLAEERGVRIEADDFSRAPPIYGDRDQLAQLFVNLLDNAVKYGGKKDGPPIRLKALGLREGAPARFGAAISDRGPGFEDHERARLTERFYRISAASSRAKGGTGLGLAIVKHIVSRHRGVLEIEGAPGKGARFSVWLPTAPASAAAASPAPAQAQAAPAPAPAPEPDA